MTGPARSSPARIRGAAAKLLTRPQAPLFDAPTSPAPENAVASAATTEEAWNALGDGPGTEARRKAQVAAINLDIQALDEALAKGRVAAEQVERPLPQRWLDRFAQLHVQRWQKVCERQATWTPELDAIGILVKATSDECAAVDPPESEAVNAAFDRVDQVAASGNAAATGAACIELITAAASAKYGGEA